IWTSTVRLPGPGGGGIGDDCGALAPRAPAAHAIAARKRSRRRSFEANPPAAPPPPNGRFALARSPRMTANGSISRRARGLNFRRGDGGRATRGAESEPAAAVALGDEIRGRDVAEVVAEAFGAVDAGEVAGSAVV